jgi:hypothetical protein
MCGWVEEKLDDPEEVDWNPLRIILAPRQGGFDNGVVNVDEGPHDTLPIAKRGYRYFGGEGQPGHLQRLAGSLSSVTPARTSAATIRTACRRKWRTA